MPSPTASPPTWAPHVLRVGERPLREDRSEVGVEGEFSPVRRCLTIAVPGGNREDFPSLEASSMRMPVERNPPTICMGGSIPNLGGQFHPNGMRITEWDRAQERKRQALEIKQTLFSPKLITSVVDSLDSPVSVRNSDLQELAEIAQNLDELLDGLSSRDLPWMRDMGGEGAEEAASPVRRLTTTLPKLNHRPIQPTRPDRPNTTFFPFGSCVEDLFTHSFQPPPRKGGWFWIQKSEVLVADAARFPTKKSEIKRLVTLPKGSNQRQRRRGEVWRTRNEVGMKSAGRMSVEVATQDRDSVAPTATAGQMLYSLQIPLEEEAENLKPNVGVMVIREGVGSVSKVTTELRYLISSTWDWKVKKIANGRYEFVATSKPDLDFLIKFTEFQCKSSDLKEKTVEEIAFLVGDPLVVDPKSIGGSGPVRVKVMSKDAAEIGGSNTVYLNGSGFKLSWKVEKKIEETKEVDVPDLQDEEDDDEDEKSDSYNPLLEEFANPSSGKATGLGAEQNSQSEAHKSRTSDSQGKHRGVGLGQNEFSDWKDSELHTSAVDIAEQNELIKTQVLLTWQRGVGLIWGGDSVAINKHLDRLKAREVAQAALTLAARNLADQSDNPVDGEEDLEVDVPLNEDHIRLVESVLAEDHVLPSEVDLFGNPAAEGKDNSKPMRTAQFIWCWVRDALGWDAIPVSLSDFLTGAVGVPGRAQNSRLIFLFAGVAWTLRKARNDWVFSDKLISSPNVLAHITVGFLQHWCKMKARKDQAEREELLAKLQEGLLLL
ncbi:hypothetical protein C2845_PM11G09330 [Panicum miliaceum]|uniref:Uncharacterized protein n=1 Tax=Panicum miliaceum TaxID=4540 RepID=A0A3L6RNR3_PANMI|nr:hypothetical protein C2845_PM11G09330 [Panicum miliaceum]